MDPKLEDLARELDECRREGNMLQLDTVLRSARILAQAKALAKRDFGKWLHDRAHMSRATANCHLRVAEFVERNVRLTKQITILSLAKVYALSTLDSDRAERLLLGEETFSKPLDQLSDVQFRKEFRERFPRERKRRTRAHVFREIEGAIRRLRDRLERGMKFMSRLTPAQINKVAGDLQDLMILAAGWKLVG
jgi:hypothetical protein